MKINFTEKEYRILVEMIQIADWVIFSESEDPGSENKPYLDLRNKLLAHVKEMGMEDLLEYSAEDDEYYETAEYEENSPHMRFIEEYNNLMFWELLAQRLAGKDIKAQEMVDPRLKEDPDAWLREFTKTEHKYKAEFETNGLMNVLVNIPTKNDLH